MAQKDEGEDEGDGGEHQRKQGCCSCGGKEEDYKTRQYSKKFKGPIHNRGCTDCLCALIFFIFFLGFVAIAVWAFVFGDPTTLVLPEDSKGNLCGIGNMKDKPILFFFDITKCFIAGPAALFTGQCPTTQICVASCPTQYWTAPQALGYVNILTGRLDPLKVEQNLICDYDVNKTSITTVGDVSKLVSDSRCAAYYMPSDSELSNSTQRCIPNLFSNVLKEAGRLVVRASDANYTLQDSAGNPINGTALQGAGKIAVEVLGTIYKAKQFGLHVLADIKLCWHYMLISLGMAMVLSFIWILLMVCIVAPMVWITLFIFVGLFGFATYWCFKTYIELKNNPNANTGFAITTDFNYYIENTNTWLALGIIAAVVLLIVVLIIIFLRKRILIAIEMMKLASKAVAMIMSVLFWPLVPFISHLVVIAAYVGSALFLTSIGRASKISMNNTALGSVAPDFKNQVKNQLLRIPCNTNMTTDGNDTSFANTLCEGIRTGVGDQEFVFVLQAYQLFMWFWLMNFVSAFSLCTLAGTFASYYFARERPKDIPTLPLLASFWRTLRYHMGSLAFGSLIIAIIQMIRVVLEYIDHKTKGSENPLAKFAVKCCKCCFWCLEKIVKFINKNAYIIIAIHGNNFCSAAKEAFCLILRNIIRFMVVDKVTDFLLFIGKLIIIGGISVLSFFFFKGGIPFVNKLLPPPTLTYYLVPVLIIVVGCYVISSAFFGVYDMGVDTIFLCFLEDEEMNDGKERPYFMREPLLKIIGKKNQKPQSGKKKNKRGGGSENAAYENEENQL